MLMECLFVFVAMTASDFLWTKYIIATTGGLPLKAAIWSSSIILINSIAVCVYVANHWTIVAAALGAFVGTFISVKRVKPQPPRGVGLHP